jgi:hypothetical protein
MDNGRKSCTSAESPFLRLFPEIDDIGRQWTWAYSVLIFLTCRRSGCDQLAGRRHYGRRTQRVDGVLLERVPERGQFPADPRARSFTTPQPRRSETSTCSLFTGSDIVGSVGRIAVVGAAALTAVSFPALKTANLQQTQLRLARATARAPARFYLSSTTSPMPSPMALSGEDRRALVVQGLLRARPA